MIIQAEKWLSEAKAGTILPTEARRHCVAYLMSSEAMTVPEMAELFQVTERTISYDKAEIRKMVAEEIKAEDVALILADIRLAFGKNLRDIEKSKAKAKLGTKTYLDHCTAGFKMQLDYMKGFQDLGVYPKELGTIHVDKFEFSATVGLDTSNTPRPVQMFDKQIPTIQAEVVESPKALSDGKEGTGTSTTTAAGVVDSKQVDDQGSKPAAPASA